MGHTVNIVKQIYSSISTKESLNLETTISAFYIASITNQRCITKHEYNHNAYEILRHSIMKGARESLHFNNMTISVVCGTAFTFNFLLSCWRRSFS